MRTFFTIVLALSMALALAACGGVPKEKIETVGKRYEALTLAYESLTNAFNEAAALIEQAGKDLSYERGAIYALGVTISTLGENISNKLAKLSEEEIDALLSELDSGLAAAKDLESQLSQFMN